MALTPTQEAQVLQLVAEQAALLSLADNEATIISKLGATKVNLSSLGSAVTFDDADIMLIRQGTTDLSIAGSVIKSTVAVPDATDTVKGKSSLAVAANYPSVSDTESATPAYVSSAVAAAPSVTGLFSNLKASATGLSALVTIAADELVVKNGTNYKTLTSVSVTPSLAASGANGLDAGTSAINTWYADFVIWGAAVPTAGLLSLSATSPTMPSGYTHKARVGWIRTDATGNKYPLSFVQYGRRVQYKVASGSNVAAMPIMATGASGSTTTPTWSSVAIGAFVPATASIIKLVGFGQGDNGGGIIVAPNNSYGAYNSATNPPPMVISESSVSTAIVGQAADFTVESTNIYYAAGVGSANKLFCFGWEDNL